MKGQWHNGREHTSGIGIQYIEDASTVDEVPRLLETYVAAERVGQLATYAAIEAAYEAHVHNGDFPNYYDIMPQTD